MFRQLWRAFLERVCACGCPEAWTMLQWTSESEDSGCRIAGGACEDEGDLSPETTSSGGLPRACSRWRCRAAQSVRGPRSADPAVVADTSSGNRDVEDAVGMELASLGVIRVSPRPFSDDDKVDEPDGCTSGIVSALLSSGKKSGGYSAGAVNWRRPSTCIREYLASGSLAV